MSYTPSLFDIETSVPTRRPCPYQRSSPTSKDAAIRAQRFAETQGERYYAWLRARGMYGATDGEAEQEMPIKRQSVCARRNALMRDGRVEDSGFRRSGCAVWVTS